MDLHLTALVLPGSADQAHAAVQQCRAGLGDQVRAYHDGQHGKERIRFAEWVGPHLDALRALAGEADVDMPRLMREAIRLDVPSLHYYAQPRAQASATHAEAASQLAHARIAMLPAPRGTDAATRAAFTAAIREYLRCHLNTNLSVVEHPLIVTARWTAPVPGLDARTGPGGPRAWRAGDLIHRRTKEGEPLFPDDIDFSEHAQAMTSLVEPLTFERALATLAERRQAARRDVSTSGTDPLETRQTLRARLLRTVFGRVIELDRPATAESRSKLLRIRDPQVPRATCQLLADMSGRRVRLPGGAILEPNLVVGNQEAWAYGVDTPTVAAIAELAARHLHPGSSQGVILRRDVVAALSAGPRADAARLGGHPAFHAAAERYGANEIALGQQFAQQLDWMVHMPTAWGSEWECPDEWGVVVHRHEHAQMQPHQLASRIDELFTALRWADIDAMRRPLVNTGRVTFLDAAGGTASEAYLRELASRLRVTIDVRDPRGKRSIEPDAGFDARLRGDAQRREQAREGMPLRLQSLMLAPAASLRTRHAPAISSTGNGYAGEAEIAFRRLCADLPLNTDPRAVAHVLGVLQDAGFIVERTRDPADEQITLRLTGDAVALHVAQLVSDVTGHRVVRPEGPALLPNLMLGSVDAWAVPLADPAEIGPLAARYLQPGSGQAVVLRADAYRLVAQDSPVLVGPAGTHEDVAASLCALADALGRPVIATPGHAATGDLYGGTELTFTDKDSLTSALPNWSSRDFPVFYPRSWGAVIPTTALVEPDTLATWLDEDVGRINQRSFDHHLFLQRMAERHGEPAPGEPELLHLDRITLWGPADEHVHACAQRLAERMGISVVLRMPEGYATIGPPLTGG